MFPSTPQQLKPVINMDYIELVVYFNCYLTNSYLNNWKIIT